MKMHSFIVTICTCAVLLPMASLRADDKREIEELKRDVPAAIRQFKRQDSTLTNFFNKSYGYVVFPRIAKGGFIFGGAGGKGLVYEKGKLVGDAIMSQATFGAQIGGQVFSEVIFFQDKTSMIGFKESRFEMAAQVSAVAAAEGVGETASYQHGVAVFTVAQSGLMVEASVGGQKFDYRPMRRPAKR